MADRLVHAWIRRPQRPSWWIAILFMIGAALFALGCVLYLGNVEHEYVLDSIFFAGSIFFTAAASLQFHQSINANKIVLVSALTQLIGTVMFNANTFDAFFNFGWMEQDLLVWTPNIIGSILFQISGSLALRDICKQFWCWQVQRMEWWIAIINFAGCVAFLMSAVLSFVTPAPMPSNYAMWATIFTLLGACCFFISSFLMWRESVSSLRQSAPSLSDQPRKNSDTDT